MKYLSHLLLVVVFAIVWLGASEVFARGGQGEESSLARRFLLEMRRSAALQEQAAAVQRAAEIKNAVVAGLLADRLTLDEAIEQFRTANELVQDTYDETAALYRTPRTKDEVHTQILHWVKNELNAHPRKTGQVPSWLEKEIAELPASFEPAW